MVSKWTSVLLLWLVLHCGHAARHLSCQQEKGYGGFTNRNYCKTRDTATNGNHYNSVHHAIEVQLGRAEFEIIYLHCCDKEYNMTSRKWFFRSFLSGDTWEAVSSKTCKALDKTNKTIACKRISSYECGFYKCITKYSDKTSQEQNIEVKEIKCINDYYKPEVTFPTDVFVNIGKSFRCSYHVIFGCKATARNISIAVYKDNDPVNIINGSSITIEGCTSSSVPRSCGGNISLPEVTKSHIGMTVFIRVQACYEGKIQEVTRNFTFLKVMDWTDDGDSIWIPLLAVSIILLLILMAVIIGICVKQKVHIWIKSRMHVLNRMIGREDAKRLHIMHPDDEKSAQLAHKVWKWIEGEYESLHVACSCNYPGRGNFTGPIEAIKESDHVVFVPGFSTDEKVFENVFNTIVQRISCFNITILESGYSQTHSCTLSNNKFFKRLKHININSGSDEEIHCSGIRSVMENIRCPHSTSRHHQEEDQSRYQKLDNCTFRSPCNDIPDGEGISDWKIIEHINSSGETNEERSCFQISMATSQPSKRLLQNNLKLCVSTGSYCEQEVSSLSRVDSPDTATTLLSPDLESNSIPYDNTSHNESTKI